MVQVQGGGAGVFLGDHLTNPRQRIRRIERELAGTAHENHRRLQLRGDPEDDLGDLGIPGAKGRHRVLATPRRLQQLVHRHKVHFVSPSGLVADSARRRAGVNVKTADCD